MSAEEEDGGIMSYHLSEDISTKNWADLMQEEQVIPPVPHDSPRDSPPLPSQSIPPFFVSVHSNGKVSAEEIYCSFGAEASVKWFSFENGKGRVELLDEKSLNAALALNGQNINESTIYVTKEIVKPSNDVRMIGGRSNNQYTTLPPRYEQPHRGGYRREDSHDHINRGGYHGGYQDNRHYNDGQHYRGGRGGYSGTHRGGYDQYGRGGGYRGRGGGYDNYSRGKPNYRGNNHYEGGQGGAPVMRSGSYSNHNDSYHHPAQINRSRTESTSSYNDNRYSSSRYSSDGPLSPSQHNQQVSPNPSIPVVPIKKPSAKSIFGDAKPVDTSKKLSEVDERLAAEEKERKDREIEEKRRLIEEEKKRVEDEKRRIENDKKREEEEARRTFEEREKAAAANTHAVPSTNPVQILRRPKEESKDNESNVNESSISIDKEYSNHGNDSRKGMEYKNKKGSGGYKREESINNDRGTYHGNRTFNNRTIYKSSSSTTTDIDVANRGKGKVGRGGRGGRGGYNNNNAGRRNSIGAMSENGGNNERRRTIDDNLMKKDPPMSEESSSSWTRVDESVPILPSSQSSLNPPITKSDPIDSNGDKKKTLIQKKKEELKEDKKKETKPPTPQKKKKNTAEKSKFATNNKYAALLEAID